LVVDEDTKTFGFLRSLTPYLDAASGESYLVGIYSPEIGSANFVKIKYSTISDTVITVAPASSANTIGLYQANAPLFDDYKSATDATKNIVVEDMGLTPANARNGDGPVIVVMSNAMFVPDGSANLHGHKLDESDGLGASTFAQTNAFADTMHRSSVAFGGNAINVKDNGVFHGNNFDASDDTP